MASCACMDCCYGVVRALHLHSVPSRQLWYWEAPLLTAEAHANTEVLGGAFYYMIHLGWVVPGVLHKQGVGQRKAREPIFTPLTPEVCPCHG